MSVLNYYNENAGRLFAVYQSIDPDSLHSIWSAFMPRDPGMALDVGGGSGRDSFWLAEKGWCVITVEPAAELMNLGRQATRSLDVTWVNDCLPQLSTLNSYQRQFGIILVGGVLMHLDGKQRAESMKTLAALMAKKSVLIITLRQGGDPDGRDFYNIPPGEIAECAQKESLQVEAVKVTPDKLGRAGVGWETTILRKR